MFVDESAAAAGAGMAHGTYKTVTILALAHTRQSRPDFGTDKTGRARFFDTHTHKTVKAAFCGAFETVKTGFYGTYETVTVAYKTVKARLWHI